MAKKTIVVCCSGSFYKHACEIADELEELGFGAIVPSTAEHMREKGDYDISKMKTWYKDPKTFSRKQFLAMEHFEKVAKKADAILIINDDKPGQPNYIGPNTLMEWGVAYYLRKPVFVLNSVEESANTFEEVYGMATVIDGNLSKIKV